MSAMRWRDHLHFGRAVGVLALGIGVFSPDWLRRWVVMPAALVVIVLALIELVYFTPAARREGDVPPNVDSTADNSAAGDKGGGPATTPAARGRESP